MLLWHLGLGMVAAGIPLLPTPGVELPFLLCRFGPDFFGGSPVALGGFAVVLCVAEGGVGCCVVQAGRLVMCPCGSTEADDVGLLCFSYAFACGVRRVGRWPGGGWIVHCASLGTCAFAGVMLANIVASVRSRLGAVGSTGGYTV